MAMNESNLQKKLDEFSKVDEAKIEKRDMLLHGPKGIVRNFLE